MKFDYDVIVIGSGAGGGVTAGLLAEAGRRVLLLERGGEPSFEEVGR
ncbi:MAG: NAD(P)-binding protein, partial [Armatimonadetes bacterium]|nr:NAD(P)-binding protein [Armatimonadota bacterium]